MDEFLLIFRRNFSASAEQPAGDDLKAHLKQWQDWYGELAADGKLARPNQRWDGQGKIVTADKNVTNGPYAEIKESIGGVVVIKAESYEQAVEIAKGSPIFAYGGNVEIRKAI